MLMEYLSTADRDPLACAVQNFEFCLLTLLPGTCKPFPREQPAPLLHTPKYEGHDVGNACYFRREAFLIMGASEA